MVDTLCELNGVFELNFECCQKLNAESWTKSCKFKHLTFELIFFVERKQSCVFHHFHGPSGAGQPFQFFQKIFSAHKRGCALRLRYVTMQPATARLRKKTERKQTRFLCPGEEQCSKECSKQNPLPLILESLHFLSAVAYCRGRSRVTSPLAI